MELFVKPFDLFEVNGQWFLLKTKSLMHKMVLQEDVAFLKEIQGKPSIAASPREQELLKYYRLTDPAPWNEEEEQTRLSQVFHSHATKKRLAVMELFVAQNCNMGCITRRISSARNPLRISDWYILLIFSRSMQFGS